MNVCVFCSANPHLDPDFNNLTRELGHWLVNEGYTVVFGGVGLGLMESMAEAICAGGGRTIGVVPRIALQRSSKYNEVEIPCDNLSDRKQIMMDQSDAFIALPGGLGTLDEVFTVVASATIGYHSRPVILYNMKQFWQPLITMLDSLQHSGVIRGQWTDYIKVADTLDELQQQLSQSFSP